MMAFHISCPITCERICYCELGFGGEERRRAFEEEARRLEGFLRDPWSVRAPEGVARVLVPRIEAPPTPPPPAEDDVAEDWPSAQAKRAALQRRGVAASVAAEDYVRRLETGAVEDGGGEPTFDLAKEDQTSSTAKVICRICFSGENEGSEKAKRMLSCKLCCKKYHKSCVKTWAENRDLFHWNFWTCPSCRICEVCRRAGDPTKFMFCKRCDAAYHCYCLQPPHKNVSHGPYLCPRHTRCHSCGSTVHGSGHSTRWFLSYNFCDACGRLFTKEKYCPVCLKVYRDSESTPMVCCDVCQRWVHCSCDGISDEKYLQFQSDRNLYYKCAACRGDCYQIRDMDDAVQELWRRRDKADCNLITSLRAAAGLPTDDDVYISPSDDEDGPVILKTDYGRTLKFSVKGLSDKAPRSTMEQGKKVSKKLVNKKSGKKKADVNFVRSEEGFLESSFVDEKKVGMPCSTPPDTTTPPTRLKFSFDNSRHINSVGKEISTKQTETDIAAKEVNSKHSGKKEPVKGTKLVIHLGGRNRNLASSPMSEASSCHREQEKPLSNGSESCGQQHKASAIGESAVSQYGGQANLRGEEGTVEDSSYPSTLVNADRIIVKDGYDGLQKTEINCVADEHEPPVAKKAIIFRRRRGAGVQTETASLVNDSTSKFTNPKEAAIGSSSENCDATDPHTFANSSSKDSRPLLKLKFKNSYLENQGLSSLEGERNIVKGQRSKRKRPPTVAERVGFQGNNNHVDLLKEDRMEEAMDASWILQKLGKDAIGKRVQVQTSGDTWQKGVVSDLVGGATLFVDLDNGKSRTLELGKQGVRLIPQKQKRTKL